MTTTQHPIDAMRATLGAGWTYEGVRDFGVHGRRCTFRHRDGKRKPALPAGAWYYRDRGCVMAAFSDDSWVSE